METFSRLGDRNVIVPAAAIGKVLHPLSIIIENAETKKEDTEICEN